REHPVRNPAQPHGETRKYTRQEGSSSPRRARPQAALKGLSCCEPSRASSSPCSPRRARRARRSPRQRRRPPRPKQPRPPDPGLRAALRGEPGETDDGLEEVRRERRRLGLEEDRDAALLSALRRRAGAVALAVVRADTEGPEVLVLDVRNAAFFEGELALAAD